MPYRANYPATADEVLDPPVIFKQNTIDALTNFKMSNPWSGTVEERFAKFKALHDSFNEIYGKTTTLKMRNINGSSSGSSHFTPSQNEITLEGKLSVVTYLHEYGHVLGKDERQTVRWSLNLFRQIFPDKFAALGRNQHMVVRQSPVRVHSHERGV